MTGGPNSQHPRPLNILSLDGGGMRGITQLLVLDYIMKRLARVSKLETVPLPCEVFDLICGISTGGLIALMLGRLRMNTKDALKFYVDFSEKIFGRNGPLTILLCRRSRCNAKALEESIRLATAKYDGSPDGLLKDPLTDNNSRKLCRTFVVVVSNAAPNEHRLLCLCDVTAPRR